MPHERGEARRLRREGTKLREIASELGVSLNSAYRWTRDIELTPEQVERNRAGPSGGGTCDPASVARRVSAWSELNRQRRRRYQAEGKARALQHEALHMAGCMLYWAEGAKSRNHVIFANSDVHMLRFFARFLTESMEVPPTDFRIRLNVYLNNGLG